MKKTSKIPKPPDSADDGYDYWEYYDNDLGLVKGRTHRK